MERADKPINVRIARCYNVAQDQPVLQNVQDPQTPSESGVMGKKNSTNGIYVFMYRLYKVYIYKYIVYVWNATLIRQSRRSFSSGHFVYI